MAKGGVNNAVYDGRHRLAARGTEQAAEASGGVGVGNIQVNSVPYRERRWGLGVNERCYDNKRY